MTEFCSNELQTTTRTKPTTFQRQSSMPSFYPTTPQRTFIDKHLTDSEEIDQDSIYKDSLIIQIFQHWKIKTLEHQQALNNAQKTSHFNQALDQNSDSASAVTTAVEERSLSDHQLDIKPRVTAVSEISRPRKDLTRRNATVSFDLSNPNLLPSNSKGKTTAGSTRKSAKPPPIFIAPKKSLPVFPSRSLALPSFEELTAAKRKVPGEKVFLSTEDSAAPTRLNFTACSSLLSINHHCNDDEDETSSDEGRQESLLIRDRKLTKTVFKGKEQINCYSSAHLNIPKAIIITDPHGKSQSVDFNYDPIEERINPTTIQDKSVLQSIGEVDEDDEISLKGSTCGCTLSDKRNRNGTMSRFIKKTGTLQNENPTEQDQNVALGRRWSDGAVSDDDEKLRLFASESSALVKMASATSLMKQPVMTHGKLSKTKYLLMKLHLTSSNNKEDEIHSSSSSSSNATTTNTTRKRTVRRSTDKKRYRTQ